MSDSTAIQRRWVLLFINIKDPRQTRILYSPNSVNNDKLIIRLGGYKVGE